MAAGIGLMRALDQVRKATRLGLIRFKIIKNSQGKMKHLDSWHRDDENISVHFHSDLLFSEQVQQHLEALHSG
jgi:hypothetical protein